MFDEPGVRSAGRPRRRDADQELPAPTSPRVGGSPITGPGNAVTARDLTDPRRRQPGAGGEAIRPERTDEVAATSHTVIEQQSFTPGAQREGTVIRTALPSGATIIDESTDERMLGVPTRRVRANEITQVDVMALNAAARDALAAQIRSDERAVADLEDQDLSPQQQRHLGELRRRLARRRSDRSELEGTADLRRVRAIVDRNDLPLGGEHTRVVEGDRDETRLGAGGVTRERTTTASGANAVLESRATTTVGPGGVVHVQRDRLTQTDEPRGIESTVTQTATTEVGPGGYRRSESLERVESDATGAVTREQRSSSRAVAAGSGALTASSSSTRRDELRLGGGHTRATERQSQASTSFRHGPEGSGLGAAASHSRSITTDGVETGVRTGGNGSFTVDVRELATDPATYRITTTIHLGASVGLSTRRQRQPDQGGATGSVGVSAEVSGDAVYTRTLDAAEARRYLGDLDEIGSGRSIGGRTEYGLLARARAVRLQSDADLTAVVSASAARDLDEGETIAIDLTAGGDIAASGGAQSGGAPTTRGTVGVSGSVGASVGRRIELVRRGPHVLVTVTVRSGERMSGSATAAYGVSTMSYGRSSADDATSSITFRLDTGDPRDFDARFGRIATLLTEPGLVQYADANPTIVVSRTGGASRTRGETVGLGVGPATVEVGQASRRRSSMTTDAGRVTGTQAGSQTTSGSLSVAGHQVLSGSTASDVEATVSATEGGAAELAVTLSQTERESDAARGLAELHRTVAERRLEDNLADLVTSGPSGLIDRILSTQSARLTEYNLEQADIDELIRRAADERIWGHAISRHQLIEPWEELRVALVEPRPPQEWRDADDTPDEKFAKQAARASALADFFGDYGERGGMAAMIWVMRHWDAGIGFDFRESTAEDIGTLFQWPQSLAATRERYGRLKQRATEFEGDIRRAYAAATDDVASVIDDMRDKSIDIIAGLRRVQREISASDDFHPPRAQLEMDLAIARLRRRVARRFRTFEEAITEAVSLPETAEATPAQLLAQREARHAALEQAEGASLPLDERSVDPVASERIADLTASLRGHTQRYSRLLDEAYELTPEDAGGGADWFWEASAGDAQDKLIEAASMHELWIRQIKDLRLLYRAAGTPEDEWKVKPHADADPRDLDPDIPRLVRYYTNIQEWLTSGSLLIPTIGWKQTRDRWRRHARY